jgi:ADP-ribosylation factor-binding protein GGA
MYQELANALMSAHPKIQKMCEEESDDHEAVAKLLEINDSIHRTIERYRLVKKGDVEGAAKIPKGTLGISGAGVSKGPNNELSLIDLDDDVQATSPSASASQEHGNTLADDLLGLSLDIGPPETGSISLGGSNDFRMFSRTSQHFAANALKKTLALAMLLTFPMIRLQVYFNRLKPAL